MLGMSPVQFVIGIFIVAALAAVIIVGLDKLYRALWKWWGD
ncbi:MAG TPA: hypothetical protein VHA30_00170 [Patescibacteria group bacterium]|nr:hypothetical protein [Patescibacteria group bacterium]